MRLLAWAAVAVVLLGCAAAPVPGGEEPAKVQEGKAAPSVELPATQLEWVTIHLAAKPTVKD